ncbi:MAG TPA: hypothetical protein VNZ64_07010 [Candidatus Acidoferrum sp.]|jgi:hypothetical protein|nr:hypothetical protein [Candidatus Acidoferrum sp.]
MSLLPSNDFVFACGTPQMAQDAERRFRAGTRGIGKSVNASSKAFPIAYEV